MPTLILLLALLLVIMIILIPVLSESTGTKVQVDKLFVEDYPYRKPS